MDGRMGVACHAMRTLRWHLGFFLRVPAFLPALDCSGMDWTGLDFFGVFLSDTWCSLAWFPACALRQRVSCFLLFDSMLLFGASFRYSRRAFLRGVVVFA
jgi:hypothetical protein